MSREELTQLWISRINDYRASGERVSTWCERHEVTPHQLYYWIKKLKKADRQTSPTGKPKWLALSLEQPTATDTSPVVVKVGSLAVEVRPGFAPAVLAEVVRTLKTLC